MFFPEVNQLLKKKSKCRPIFEMQGKGVSIPKRLRRVGFAARERDRCIGKARQTR